MKTTADRATVDRRRVALRLERLRDHLQTHCNMAATEPPPALRYVEVLKALDRIGVEPGTFFGEMCQIWTAVDHRDVAHLVVGILERLDVGPGAFLAELLPGPFFAEVSQIWAARRDRALGRRVAPRDLEPPAELGEVLELLDRIGAELGAFLAELWPLLAPPRDPGDQMAALRDHLAAVIRRQGADVEPPKDPELGEVLEVLDQIGVEPGAFFAEVWPSRDPGEAGER